MIKNQSDRYVRNVGDKIKQGDKVVVDVANLEGELSMEVNGERIPLVAAFEPKDVPVLKLGGALPQFKALHAG